MSQPQTPYQILGEDGIRQLAAAFYEIMAQAPDLEKLRRMHGDDLSAIRDKLGDYLVGWMGGPPLYERKTGTVCLTDPHEPYHIGPEERDLWLSCMDRALAQIGASEELVEMLKVPMYRVADTVRNREGPSAATTNPDIIASH